jgi:hypothetical protein
LATLAFRFPARFNDKKMCVSILRLIGATYILRSLAWIKPRWHLSITDLLTGLLNRW